MIWLQHHPPGHFGSLKVLVSAADTLRNVKWTKGTELSRTAPATFLTHSSQLSSWPYRQHIHQIQSFRTLIGYRVQQQMSPVVHFSLTSIYGVQFERMEMKNYIKQKQKYEEYEIWRRYVRNLVGPGGSWWWSMLCCQLKRKTTTKMNLFMIPSLIPAVESGLKQSLVLRMVHQLPKMIMGQNNYSVFQKANKCAECRPPPSQK